MGAFLIANFRRLDAVLASASLIAMVLIALIEILVRPLAGAGIENAPVVVQHLGLVMAMFGSSAAVRSGHLSSLAGGWESSTFPRCSLWSQRFGKLFAAAVCGALCAASWRFVDSERLVSGVLAYSVPVWWFQVPLPLGFLLLGLQLGSAASKGWYGRLLGGLLSTALGAAMVWWLDGTAISLWPLLLGLLLALIAGAPIFAVLGALALSLSWQDAMPLASIPLSHYQITVNPSLPALPMFTLAGLLFARTGAAKRLGLVFVALFGGGATGTTIAAAVLCSAFTAFTGGSGVTILALGGLLLPLLRDAGLPERRGISLVTSASALGVLLAPSVPLIMYAIIARVPINTMFLAGILPAFIMVAFLLVFGGYLKRPNLTQTAINLQPDHVPGNLARPSLKVAVWDAKWEILAPFAVIGALVSGLATPTESAAIAVAYAVLTQAFAHHELDWRKLLKTTSDGTQIIGGVLLILGMALGLTNYLIASGIPDMAIEWVQDFIPNKWVFLLVLNFFLFFAGALMEIFAAIVVLVPLLLPVAVSYGIDPVHFGIIFLANMELGFLCPPAGMNIYFASAMFQKPVRYVAAAVLPALLAIFLGTLCISLLPSVATYLPTRILGGQH